MSNDGVRDVIASLRSGDEVEIVHHSKVVIVNSNGSITDESGRVWFRPDDIRIIKRAPLPEPPAGTPVWWDGKWWIKDEPDAAYAPTLWAERDTVKFWQFMPGAVPAATPGGDG